MKYRTEHRIEVGRDQQSESQDRQEDSIRYPQDQRIPGDRTMSNGRNRFFLTSIDYAVSVTFMDDQTAGQLFKASCSYAQDQNRELALSYLPDDQRLRALFQRHADIIDEGFISAEKRRNAGKSGANARWRSDEEREENPQDQSELIRRTISIKR